ncbi:uncharacterized protein DUF3253 [Motilibacter peucedani]|uniref:Uncharacterized protein DUF3253 n=1 Tax=Motilibacter peucedani TaxID=598650 RepID=A0A420XUV3_9ACTN|nr:uncharacterized protein DUF3253 [Motilibacter peucedani]
MTGPLTGNDQRVSLPQEQRLDDTIRTLLDARAPGATICPSEVARAVGGEQWRGLMDAARAAVGRLVASGEVDVTQHGEVVDLASARGPVRIRRR